MYSTYARSARSVRFLRGHTVARCGEVVHCPAHGVHEDRHFPAQGHAGVLNVPDAAVPAVRFLAQLAVQPAAVL